MTCPYLKKRINKRQYELGNSRPLPDATKLYCSPGRLKGIPLDEDIIDRCKALSDSSTEAECPSKKEGL